MKTRFAQFYILGQSGSGKTTLGNVLSKKTGIKFIELDQVWHKHNRNRETFTKHVLTKIIPARNWIIDGKYRTVREELMNQADMIIYLDIPFIISLKQNILRELNKEKRITYSFMQHILKFTREFFPTRKEIIRQLAKHNKKTVILHSFREIDNFLEKFEKGVGV